MPQGQKILLLECVDEIQERMTKVHLLEPGQVIICVDDDMILERALHNGIVRVFILITNKAGRKQSDQRYPHYMQTGIYCGF
jgi:hypothetical protein